MLNELNPCVKCGGNLIARAETPDLLSSLNWEYRTCAGCGNTMLILTGDGKEADAAWNAANPKEGKLDDTQTV